MSREITKIMIIIIELDKPLMLPAGIFSSAYRERISGRLMFNCAAM
jgi:hypothetical protein